MKVRKASRGPVQAGTRYHCTANIAALRFEYDFHVCTYEPPHHYVTEGSCFGAQGRTEWKFTPQRSGTKVTVRITGDVADIPFVHLLGSLLWQRIMERDIEEGLKRVKAELEKEEKQAAKA